MRMILRFLLRLFKLLFFWYKIKKLNKDATFLSKKDEKKLLNPKNDWLLLDGDKKRLSQKHSFEHIAIIARTGAWKTTGYIIPNILTLDNCSIIVTDPSGEIRAKTQDILKKRWFKIVVLNPINLKESQTYNPLVFANSSDEIKEISKILVSSSNTSSGAEDKFWNAGAEKIINIILRCLKNKEKLEKVEVNLKDLQRQLNYFLTKRWTEFIATYGDDDIVDEYKWFLSGNEKTTQSFLSTAQISLDSLSNENISNFLSKNSLKFQDLRDEKTVLFFQIPENKIHYYSFLLNLFYTQFFNFATDDLNNTNLPIYALLDEFGNMTIPHFSNIITIIRKYRVSISIILQSISQLEAVYTKTQADIILNGWITSKVFYNWADPTTSKMVSEIIGTTTQKDEDTNYKIKENLINSFNIRTLWDSQAIYIYGNKQPVLLDIVPFYENERFKKFWI